MNFSAPPCMGSGCDLLVAEGIALLMLYAVAAIFAVWLIYRGVRRILR